MTVHYGRLDLQFKTTPNKIRSIQDSVPFSFFLWGRKPVLVVLAIQTSEISSLSLDYSKRSESGVAVKRKMEQSFFFFIFAFRSTLHFLFSLTPLTAKARINTGVSPLYRLAKLSFLT